MEDSVAIGDCGSVIPELETEKSLTAAAKHIARASGSKKNVTDDAKKILADLDTQLFNTSTVNEIKVDTPGEIEGQLNFIQEKIMSWETDQSMMRDSGLDEATQFLNATEEARKLAERLETLSLNKDDGKKELLTRARDILQIAMGRLEEEFKHHLDQNRRAFEPERMSFCLSEECGTEPGSVISLGDGSVEPLISRDSISRTSEEFIIDLVNPEVISHLRKIANLMFISGYGDECSQAYISVRRDALDECFFILKKKEVSFEDVVKLEWGSLNSQITKWVQAMKIFVSVYLPSEKRLTQLIFGEHDFFVRTNGGEILWRLRDSVMEAYLDFENAIETGVPPHPCAGGGIHDLTRYVMNYINTLNDYHETLNFLLKGLDGEDPISLSPVPSGITYDASPMALHCRSVASILECNLDDTAKLYRDPSLQHIFLMNNIHYMAQELDNLKLMHLFADDWIRKLNWKVQQRLMSYERTTWVSVLSLLMVVGPSYSVSKNLIKEKLRRFHLAFEEVYRTQTAWLIPDAALREDLHISITTKVIQAYRTFVGRYSNFITPKNVKYSFDDLENFLLDLFQGSKKSLPYRRFFFVI
ncbi:exocyst complex component EXO70E2 [Manihot esculenta]|uniref:Exocyst subunit Exo70 family protein n=1 Tax=Manihot esculenta TaxID=3983 RepID=A0A2C9WCP6_MANES|nr:exocyst complex component EXO70E2 [Manihot esculenta]OAY56911.1 hypothetical protein MANES_02G054900v8 [Manihot esculenta]